MNDETKQPTVLPTLLAPQEIAPKQPPELTGEVIQKVEGDVALAAKSVGENLENRTFLATLDNLGRKDQDIATEKIDLVATRVNSLVKTTDATGATIPEIVTELRTAVDELNPKRDEQHWFARLVGVLPGGKTALEFWWASGLRQIARRRETIRDTIREISRGLLGNKEQLDEDTAELNRVYDFVSKGPLVQLQVSAYSGELLFVKLQEMLDAMPPEDPKRDRLRRAMERVAVRVRSLRLTENALQQALAGIDITTDGNVKVGQALEETGLLTRNFLTVAMALYQALEHQKQAALAVVRARGATADVMLRTSEMAKESAASVSELYFNPQAELAKVDSAHRNLMAAFQTLEDASRNGLVLARDSAEKLHTMTLELRAKQEQLRGSQAAAEPVR